MKLFFGLLSCFVAPLEHESPVVPAPPPSPVTIPVLPSAAPEPLDPSTLAEGAVVFIGTVSSDVSTLVRSFQDLGSGPAAAVPHMDDKSVFPDRFFITLTPVELVKFSMPPPWERVDVAMVMSAGAGERYSAQQMALVQAHFSQPFVVVIGVPIYVDHGNSMKSAAIDAWDIGTSPLMPNHGFQTLEQAQAYVSKVGAISISQPSAEH